MFGDVKPYSPELRVKEYDFYRSTYCGICRAMKHHTGVLSNVTLSYDSVFLALVRMLYIPKEQIGAEKKNCITHPFKKKVMLKENDALIYTAKAFAVLTYYKLTPVITFRTGGSPECIDSTSGCVVDCDDIDTMEREIYRIAKEKPFTVEACLERAKAFDMKERFEEYIELYQTMQT